MSASMREIAQKNAIARPANTSAIQSTRDNPAHRLALGGVVAASSHEVTLR